MHKFLRILTYGSVFKKTRRKRVDRFQFVLAFMLLASTDGKAEARIRASWHV